MTDEKWLDMIDNLKQKFEVERELSEQITTDDVGTQIINKIDRVTFENDLGEFKVERITRPAILDKKVHYSHSSGSKGLVEYILSPDETTSKIVIYKKDGNDWHELDVPAERMNF